MGSGKKMVHHALGVACRRQPSLSVIYILQLLGKNHYHTG